MDSFDFDTWCSDKDLTPLKNALIGLEFNNLSSVLSLSEPLIAFILSSHPSLQIINANDKNKLKLSLIDAVQKLKQTSLIDAVQHETIEKLEEKKQESFHKNGNDISNGKKSQNTFLIITNEENKVLISLKNKMKTIEKYENKLSDIEKQYEIHKIKAKDLYTKEMEKLHNSLNKTFEKLHNSLNKQHKLLLNKTNNIKQNELNDEGLSINFNQEIKECFILLDEQRTLLTNSINKYQSIMANSTHSSKQLLEFDEDLTRRSNLISTMGNSVEKQFISATNKWNEIICNINNKFKKEFQLLGHWTFVISDVMKDLKNNNYQIGIINKITTTSIIDVDWIDNGSLVLYLSNNNNNNNMELKKYKIRYKYIIKNQNEIDDNQSDIELEEVDKELLNEMDKQENEIFKLNTKSNEWIELNFNNCEHQFLSTIPLKIQPFSTYNSKLLNNCVNEQYQFVYIAQFISIQIQICCQFELIKQCMSFWTNLSPIYTINENNIVLNDNLRIDENSNQFIINQHRERNNSHSIILEQKDNEFEQSIQIINDINDDLNDINNNDINDNINFNQEEDLIFSSCMVRAWRFDEEQGKWRGRGKGNLFLYKHKEFNTVRIIFKDAKHENKIRLLQKIDYLYEHCNTNLPNEIEWHGGDYSMDPHEPLNSLWKIKFIDQPEKIVKFIMMFNNAVDDAIIKHSSL